MSDMMNFSINHLQKEFVQVSSNCIKLDEWWHCYKSDGSINMSDSSDQTGCYQANSSAWLLEPKTEPLKVKVQDVKVGL